MTWARLDDGFPDHPKVVLLSDRAFRLHVTAICYCARNLTDGAVTTRALKIISAGIGRTQTRQAHELVQAGLWEATNDGFVVHDYTDFNPSAAEVTEQRKRAAERQRRHRHAVTNTVGHKTPSPTPNTLASLPNAPRTADDVEGANNTPQRRQPDPTTLGRLIAACGGGKQAATKIRRTIICHRSSEADIAWALESATGPAVRDPLAVALTELKRRSSNSRPGERHPLIPQVNARGR